MAAPARDEEVRLAKVCERALFLKPAVDVFGPPFGDSVDASFDVLIDADLEVAHLDDGPTKNAICSSTLPSGAKSASWANMALPRLSSRMRRAASASFGWA